MQRGFLPDLKQMVDLEMWLHILMQGDFVYTHEPLCAFRRHELQQTSKNRADNAIELEMVQIVRQYLSVALTGARSPKRLEQEIIFQAKYSLHKHFGKKCTSLEQYGWLASRFQPCWQAYFLMKRKMCGPFAKIKSSLKKKIWKKFGVDLYPKAKAFLSDVAENIPASAE